MNDSAITTENRVSRAFFDLWFHFDAVAMDGDLPQWIRRCADLTGRSFSRMGEFIEGHGWRIYDEERDCLRPMTWADTRRGLEKSALAAKVYFFGTANA